MDAKRPANPTAYLTATDGLGRRVEAARQERPGRSVGIFYFLWVGASSWEGPFDVSKVKQKDPDAGRSSEAWRAAGGGEIGQRHWWGESLFGYFRCSDPWVVERDVQMLTDAGIDFLGVDFSNATLYPKELQVLLQTLDKFYRQGFNVPRITFITKAKSGATAMWLYENYYKKYPQYTHLWYSLQGKPLMLADRGDPAVSDECRDYFYWRWPQWPKEPFRENGFPWMDFSEKQVLYGGQTGPTVMSVSLAQHTGTLAFSSGALYKSDKNRTRSWHDGANDHAPDAVLYGYNFDEQFAWALEQDPDIIFITGWNEWIATRQKVWPLRGEPLPDPVILVDNCDINNSRDIQPMKGGYGDNYYMQMISWIRRYKGLSVVNRNLDTASSAVRTTIDINGPFSQWDTVTPFYLDYTGDVTPRSHVGWGELYYTDNTGRNDFYKLKMTHDGIMLYAYAQTVQEIKGMGQERCMTLFVSTGRENETWNGYDFAIGRAAACGGRLSVERWKDGVWQKIGAAAFALKGSELQLAVPLTLLGLCPDDVHLEFKWADNYQKEDISSFYLYGDAAPYGRLNFVYEGGSEE